MSLFSRTPDDVDGIVGTLRDVSTGAKGRRKIRPGDIAVLEAPDLSRREAQFLIDARPAAVINAAPFTTGGTPNYGPLMLIDAGITLVDNAGAELRAGAKDGAKNTLVTPKGAVFVGGAEIGSGDVLTREQAEERFAAAQRNLVSQMDSYFARSVKFINSEGPLLIDGLGIPDLGDTLTGRKVLVLAPGEDEGERLRRLRNFIREYEPVLIGVGGATNTLVEAGYKPDIFIGDPHEVDAETLRGDVRVILPADPEGSAVGIERIQELGVAAMTFPAALSNPTDLALLLADHHEPEFIVLSGAPVNLDGIFARRPDSSPGSALTRLKVGQRLVDAQVVDDLYTVQSHGAMAWLWALLGLLVALAAVIAVVGFGGSQDFSSNLTETWDGIAAWFQQLLK